MPDVIGDWSTQPVLIRPTVQHYRWGRRGSQALVGRLANLADGNEPNAELWVGAHPSSSSIALLESGEVPLRALIQNDPGAALGAEVVRRFGTELPFLLKVLSIDEPLSLQLHPDKHTAEGLHQRFPQRFKDPNHKPELAIALEPASLFYGFRRDSELFRLYAEIPAFAQALKIAQPASHAEIIRAVGSADADTVRSLKAPLERHLKTHSPSVAEIFARSIELFGDCDRGLLLLPLLQFVNLSEGSSVFVEPNKVHAYVSGELLECMANSDNVIRVGLTPKEQDFPLAAELITGGSEASAPPVDSPALTAGVRSYAIRSETFKISTVERAAESYSLSGPSVVLALSGTVDVVAPRQTFALNAGEAIFIPYAAAGVRLESARGKAAHATVGI